jgi:hypothetical protein
MTSGTRLMLFSILGFAALLKLTFSPPKFEADNFICHHEPSCCDEGKHYLHKYDCEGK